VTTNFSGGDLLHVMSLSQAEKYIIILMITISSTLLMQWSACYALFQAYYCENFADAAYSDTGFISMLENQVCTDFVLLKLRK
jgi:hypothetical protein